MAEPIKITDDDDAWDDELLIQEYNRTVRLVDQRISEIESGDLGKTNEIRKEKRKSKNKDDSKELLWKPGDNCVAVFKEDGLEYEAKIVSIDQKYGCCVVKYLGYDNEECQYLQDLKPSRGLQSQLEQMQLGFVNCELEDEELSRGIQNMNTRPEFIPESPLQSQGTTPEFILPPPPTFLTSNLTEPLAKENDALASMLMSWYMCGFQTGYYTALKQMKVKE
ncbi:survival motor neuron protein-like [Tetranychus urticae]|uniref:Tudor domain-containing protein n=1 Tax=Tetranychus urticae TaxID=32264 RepID=T1K6U7_TETUR|nr:survival motor neuron protein-like [Tetranychus urticae]